MFCFFVVTSSFFFSSRRRHTRFSRDWSSDVCSSDLLLLALPGLGAAGPLDAQVTAPVPLPSAQEAQVARDTLPVLSLPTRGPARSEERRVGRGRLIPGSAQRC